jgi:tetratricopeptide (TPR) repeat protein
VGTTVYPAYMANAMVAPSGIVGSQIGGRYDVSKQLGAGGSAFVFLARDTRYHRDVAIKILRPEIAGAIGAERFLREINILAGLQHPNILPLYDSGMADSLPFFVTPYVSGKSLRDRLIAETSLPLDDASRIVREVAEALDFAHAHGIVHRDIKPENVLLHGDHACLGDFGIARAIDVAAGEELTDSRFAIGTPAYMSPEQGAGGDKVGPGTDVYSLGILAYEMLTGGVPYTGATTWAIQARKLLDPVPSLRTVRSTIGPGVEAAVKRALAVTPADRWPSAGAFARALTAPQPVVVPASWRRAAMLLLVVILAALGLVAWRRMTVASARRTPPRVVVAEFYNVTGDRSLDYLGITAVDWLTEGLQRTGVISGVATESAIRASRFVRDNRSAPVQDPILSLAKEAGADIVVSGRIYRSRDSLQYQIQVTDAKTRNLLGAIGPVATPVTDPLSGLVQVRSRLMGLLAARVDDRLGEFAAGLPAPPIYEAYREFSLGLDRYIQGDFSAAGPLFEAAYSRDTAFAAPVLFASITLSNQGRYREADSLLDRLSSQRERLTPFQQSWLDYRRALMAGQRPAALDAVRTLDSLDPGSKATYNHAIEALENGYVDEAITTLRSLSPDQGAMRRWIPYYEVLGSAYHLAGRFSDELAVGEEARRRFPDRLYAFLPSVRALGALDRTPALNAVLANAAALSPDPYGTTLSQLYVEAGDELRAHGDARESQPYYSKALELTKASPATAAKQENLRLTAEAQKGLGRWSDVTNTAATLNRLDSADPDYRGMLGTALARVGKNVEAASILSALDGDRRPYLFGRVALAEARIATALGHTDEALAYLKRSFAEGRQFDLWVHRDADFDALRPVPQFQALVALKRER